MGLEIVIQKSKIMLYCDPMKILRWKNICENDESLHIATIEMGKTRSTAMHRHDFYECFLVLEGHGQHVMPSGTEMLQANHLYFIRPEHCHAVTGQADLVFLNIAFEASVFEKAEALSVFSRACWPPGLPIKNLRLSQNQSMALRTCIDDIAGQPGRRNAAWLLLSLARILDDPVSRKYSNNEIPEWMANGLNRAMDEDVLRQGVAGLTLAMGRSREHVTRSFQKYLKMTPTQWLNIERIKHARRLLTTTRLSVMEIALECGYESPSHFHKCFKQQAGTSPLRYRSKLTCVQA